MARLLSDTEIRRVQADAAYWREIEQPLGWTLLGFSRRFSATYITPTRGQLTDTLVLSGPQRDAIAHALQAARIARDSE